MAGNTWASGCRGKIQYPSRKMAAAAIRRMRREGAAVAPDTLEPYRCREMRDHWHVGHSVRPTLPPKLLRVKAAAGDLVEIAWRMLDGSEVVERRSSPKEGSVDAPVPRESAITSDLPRPDPAEGGT